MLSQDLIAQLAAELHESERSRVQVEHFSKRFPDMTIEDGYAVPPQSPGLGIDWDFAAIERAAVARATIAR